MRHHLCMTTASGMLPPYGQPTNTFVALLKFCWTVLEQSAAAVLGSHTSGTAEHSATCTICEVSISAVRCYTLQGAHLACRLDLHVQQHSHNRCYQEHAQVNG
jgi:hypothetical protein